MFKREKDEIYYNKENKTYTKIIKPRLNKRIKYFFRLRKYPGENVKYIAKLLEKNGIDTLKVIQAEKYLTITKEIIGNTLIKEIRMTKNDEKKSYLVKKYIETVVKIINLGIYYGDFNFGNFIVSNDKLYVIDLEDYRKDFFSKFRKKDMMKRLKKTLDFIQNDLKKEKINIDAAKIYLEIKIKTK